MRESGQKVGQVEPPVKGRQALVGEMLEQRQLNEVDVKVDEIILVGIGADLVDHRHGIGNMTVDPVESQSTRRAGYQFGRRFAVAAGIERHIMAEIDQRFGEPPDDSFGPTVELGRNGFGQRRDLGDAQ